MATAQCLVFMEISGLLPSWLHEAITKPSAGISGRLPRLGLSTASPGRLLHVSLVLSQCLGESRWPGWCSLEWVALAVPWLLSPPAVAWLGQSSLGPAPAQATAHISGNNQKSPGENRYPILCFLFLQAVTSGSGNNTSNCSHHISCNTPSSTWRADPIPSLPRVENRLLLPSSPHFVHHYPLGIWLQFSSLYLGTGECCACFLLVSFVCSFHFHMCLGRMSGCLLLTTQQVDTLLTTTRAACSSRLVWLHWVIPTAKENNTALKQPLGKHSYPLLNRF